VTSSFKTSLKAGKFMLRTFHTQPNFGVQLNPLTVSTSSQKNKTPTPKPPFKTRKSCTICCQFFLLLPFSHFRGFWAKTIFETHLFFQLLFNPL